MAWSPNKQPHAAQEELRPEQQRRVPGLDPVVEAGPPTDLVRPAEQGGEAGQGGPRIREHPAHYEHKRVGQQGVGVQHADDRCRGFLHATVDRRRPAGGQ